MASELEKEIRRISEVIAARKDRAYGPSCVGWINNMIGAWIWMSVLCIPLSGLSSFLQRRCRLSGDIVYGLHSRRPLIDFKYLYDTKLSLCRPTLHT